MWFALVVALWFSPPAQAPKTETFTVEGAERQALVYANRQPAPKEGAPLLLVFHGHGGQAQKAARRFRLHELWPQAVVVYLQGIAGVEGITDKAGAKSGWQKNPGDLQDRDIKFVDATLERITSQHKIDAKRVYAFGHSNGARFVNVLWAARGDKFAALCSAAAQGGNLLQEVKPKSIFMIAGEQDPLVPFKGQMLSVAYAREKLLKTDPAKARIEGYARFETGVNNTELATYLHPGGHEVPAEALPLVIAFFQRH
jgi:polyhydroxybutyrate depolymerase